MFIDGNVMMFVILGSILLVILALYLMLRRTVLAFNEGVDERR